MFTALFNMVSQLDALVSATASTAGVPESEVWEVLRSLSATTKNSQIYWAVPLYNHVASGKSLDEVRKILHVTK